MLSDSREISASSSLGVHAMPRSRLDEIFNAASCESLICVVAGAGYGKNQAVHHYLSQQKDTVVRWLPLSEVDNRGSRFWESLIHAISFDDVQLADELRELGFPQTPAMFKRFAEIMRDAERGKRKAYFILDDAHVLYSEEVLAFIEQFACVHIPNVRIVILARKMPNINVMPLLSRSKALIIDEKELRFTSAEIAEFFHMHNVPLPAQDLERIADATRGWPLAISMLLFSLKRMFYSLDKALIATKENIFNLLEVEAWEGLSLEVQKVMAKISLLPNLPVLPLRDLIQDMDSLQEVPELSSFVCFDNFINNYRVHPLYLEFLRTKTSALSEGEKQEVYGKAAQWCSDNNFLMDALYYYEKTQQFDRMVQTLLEHPFKLPRDDSEYILDILKGIALDDEGIDERDALPSVLFLKNYFVPLLLVGAGRYEEAKKTAAAIAERWEHIDNPISAPLLYAIYTALAYIDMYICTVTHQYESAQYMSKAIDCLDRIPLTRDEAAETFISADIRSFACVVGEGASLAQFEHFLEQAKQLASYIEKTPQGIYSGYDDLAFCEYAYFMNQPDLARRHAHAAIVSAREKKQFPIQALSENYLLLTAVQEGDTLLVKEVLGQMHAHLENKNFWNRQLYHDLYMGAFYARIGIIQVVPAWLIDNEKELASEIRIPARRLYVNALYHIAAKNYHQALAVLSNSYPREPQERFLFGEIRLSLLTAVAKIRTGDTAGALSDLGKAHQLSYQGKFEMFFIELGKELHPLVAAAMKQSNFITSQKWLRAVERKASAYAKKADIVAQGLRRELGITEPILLSSREQKVLLDLYHGLSREEIAESQSLSVNTVKKVLQSIYVKLHASNNVDAIRIALERGLLG